MADEGELRMTQRNASGDGVVERSIAIVGCGFVADLYMRSLPLHPGLRVVGVWDTDAARLKTFCAHWNVPAMGSLEEVLSCVPQDGLVLNLTNPKAHFEISKAALEAGKHVYSEKPLALKVEDARVLCDMARDRGLMLGSAPCSVLGEAAQTLGRALRDDVAGPVRLVYAELNDGFMPQAAYKDWKTDTGAPWPYQDEFEVGCTLEHAGYFLTWLIAWFGSVRTVVSASAEVVLDKTGTGPTAPDFSSAVLFFESGPVVRITCSSIAPHDHSIRVVGDKGVLACGAAWDNAAKVTFSKRMLLRRRLIDSPIKRRIKLKGSTHPKVKRWGAAALDFLLGPEEMIEALRSGRETRMSRDFALHLTEVTLAIQNAGETTGAQAMTSRCDPLEPMPWAV